MSSIKRPDFNRHLQNTSIDVNKAKQDTDLAGVNLDKADLNHDGKIAGAAETDQLFLEIDKMDRDGSYQSMDVGNDKVKSAILAAADQAGAPGLKAHMARIEQMTGTGGTGPTNTDVAKAADDLVSNYAQNYGVDDPWFNLDPKHALPANVRLGGLKGRWKCNLFAGNVMAKAGFEPPYYGNRGSGEYPNANQFFKWSDKYAGQYGNKEHFKLKAEVLNVDQMSSDEKKTAIMELLKKAEPGDFIFVDHRGADVSDGGHCRVVTENTLDDQGNGAVKCAQASHGQAEVQDEKVFDFTGEEHIWLMKATKPRVGNS